MPPKRASSSKPKKAKRRAVLTLNDVLTDETDRYGEVFINKHNDFQCVHPCCVALGEWPVSAQCNHAFYACHMHRVDVLLLKFSPVECLFCHRRSSDKLRRILHIATVLPLTEDFYGDKKIMDYLVVISDHQ